MIMDEVRERRVSYRKQLMWDRINKFIYKVDNHGYELDCKTFLYMVYFSYWIRGILSVFFLLVIN